MSSPTKGPEATRSAILAAAVSLLVEFGHSKTSSLAVQRRAQVSRGALLHHFPTTESLVSSAVEQLLQTNLQAVRDECAMTPLEPDMLARGIGILYRASRRPEFAAELEIWAAARVSAELADAVGGAERPARVELRTVIDDCFGPELAALPGYGVMVDLSIHLLRGLTISGSLQGARPYPVALTNWVPIARSVVKGASVVDWTL